MTQCQPSSVATSLREWKVVDQNEDQLAEKLHRWWHDRDDFMPWNQSKEQLRTAIT